MQYYPFDSRNPLYRSKIGAIGCDQKIMFRLLLHKDAMCSAAFLRLVNDKTNTLEEIPLYPCEYLEDYRFWDCEISFEVGLYWYTFRYESPYGEFFVTKCEHSKGFVSKDGSSWQQTVYTADFNTPEWLSNGIIYQIFPDRFYHSKIANNEFSDRYICNDTNKQPEFRQNNGVCSLGNDYYGGNLNGIIEKLPYLAGLGINCIYLNPIFEAHSNHRYNTADYMKIDSLLGDEQTLKELCQTAKKFDIRIILDGAFSHTGDDSIYFNKYNRYDSIGAYNSPQSQYNSWYKFGDTRDSYSAWWGVPSLPETNENDPSFTDFITGEKGVLRHWLDLGIYGWRLDVADELPDKFLEKIRFATKSHNKDAYLLGEVWEDASNKISYSSRRKFLLGNQLDSVMNYPFANAIIDFIESGNSFGFADTIYTILENYPPQSIKTLMNHIGTHDTARILTRLAENFEFNPSRQWQSKQSLNEFQYKKAVEKLKIAVAIQFFLPGIPSIFYGDEIGTQGYSDPFCRSYFNWNNIDTDLLNFYKTLGKLRRGSDCTIEGDFITIHCENGYLVFMRKSKIDAVLIAVNLNDYDVCVSFPHEFKKTKEVIFGDPSTDDDFTIGANNISIFKTQF